MKIVIGEPERGEPPLYMWSRPSATGNGITLHGSRGRGGYPILKVTDQGVQFYMHLPPECGLPLNMDGSIKVVKNIPDANADREANG